MQVDARTAVSNLTSTSPTPPLVPSLQWLLPEPHETHKLTTRSSRASPPNSKRSGELINPIIAQRRARLAELAASGAGEAELQAAVKNDGIEWFARMAARDGRTFEPELAQITMSVAAIHTTTDLLTQVVCDLATHPEVLAPLRAEVADVIGRDGWRKTSLFGLKMLDSCIRETQRLKPIGMGEWDSSSFSSPRPCGGGGRQLRRTARSGRR